MKKVVLVTGSTSGLGREIAEHLAAKGFIVYGGSRSAQKEKDFNSIKLDITSDLSCKNAVRSILKKERRLDVLINCAGYTLVGPFEKNSSSDFLKILDTNAVGAFRLISQVVPIMKKQNKGKIINITSMNGLVSFPNYSLYSASKHALEALSSALRYELIGSNIYVTSVEPGAIKSSTNLDFSRFPHKPAREKFILLKLLLPMVSSQQIVKRIFTLIEDSKPPANVLLGRDVLFVTWMKRFLPSPLWDKLMVFIWKK